MSTPGQRPRGDPRLSVGASGAHYPSPECWELQSRGNQGPEARMCQEAATGANARHSLRQGPLPKDTCTRAAHHDPQGLGAGAGPVQVCLGLSWSSPEGSTAWMPQTQVNPILAACSGHCSGCSVPSCHLCGFTRKMVNPQAWLGCYRCWCLASWHTTSHSYRKGRESRC